MMGKASRGGKGPDRAHRRAGRGGVDGNPRTSIHCN